MAFHTRKRLRHVREEAERRARETLLAAVWLCTTNPARAPRTDLHSLRVRREGIPASLARSWPRGLPQGTRVPPCSSRTRWKGKTLGRFCGEAYGREKDWRQGGVLNADAKWRSSDTSPSTVGARTKRRAAPNLPPCQGYGCVRARKEDRRVLSASGTLRQTSGRMDNARSGSHLARIRPWIELCWLLSAGLGINIDLALGPRTDTQAGPDASANLGEAGFPSVAEKPRSTPARGCDPVWLLESAAVVNDDLPDGHMTDC
jgi:hypothetical protein